MGGYRGAIEIKQFSGRRFAIICCSLFLMLSLTSVSVLYGQESGFKILDRRKVAEIPFKNINNLIVISVVMNDFLPLQFILDSGVRTPLLTDKFFSDLLNISYAKKLSLQGAGIAQQVDAYVAYNVSFSLPNMKAVGQSILVLEEDYLELGKQLGSPVHGILGYDLFTRFVVKINYEEGFISLYEPADFKPEHGYTKFDLSLENTKPYIQAEIVERPFGKKKAVKLMLDTGAGHALLLHQDKNDERIWLPEKTIYGHLGRGLVGDIMGKIGRVQAFYLQDFTFNSVLTSFPDTDSYGNIADWGDRHGTIGGDLLSRFTVIFDYSGGAFYLKKNRSYKDPFVYSKTGMALVADGEDLKTFKVVRVRENSPASKAGIKVGDEIIKVNGIKARRFRLPQLLEKFRKRDGKRIRLKMKREEEEYKTKFRLRNII